MRRFFRAQRDEDYSQIQYLTAKCTRLSHDKAILDREFLLSRDRERKLLNDLNVVTTRLVQQEQVNMELRMKHDQLTSRIHQQQDMLVLLKQRVALLAEESNRHVELLRQVGTELLCLQSSEVKLESLVEELNDEAEHRTVVAESLRAELHNEARRRVETTDSLQAQLHSKTVELDELHGINQTLAEELKNISRAHHKEVRALQQENEGSLGKLQETAEQFEWLCQQQRYWMCCVKKFKACLMEEREALLQQVKKLQKEAKKLKTSSQGDRATQSHCSPPQDTAAHSEALWDVDKVAALESQMEKSNLLYEKLFKQAGTPINGHQKPP